MNDNTETVPDFQEFNAVHEGRDRYETDTCDANHGDINLVHSNSNDVNKEVSIPAEHVTKNVQLGPAKPMAKWTRIPRMDCGLENGDVVQSFPILGKRGPA